MASRGIMNWEEPSRLHTAINNDVRRDDVEMKALSELIFSKHL
jgi:hypothetical protein